VVTGQVSLLPRIQQPDGAYPFVGRESVFCGFGVDVVRESGETGASGAVTRPP
jgi:hypothetical protein